MAFQREHGLRPEQITLIHGGDGRRDRAGRIVRGLDILAGEVAAELGWAVIEVKAKWHLGNHAGPVRNQLMIDKHKPTHSMAFGVLVRDGRKTGTGDCFARMRKAGIRPEHWETNG